jgi:hypothetical protein
MPQEPTMARRTASSRLAAALVALACTAPTRWAAADATAADRALAQSLFDDGRKLMDARDYTQACPKFAESERLDPGGGTILNLALCHEAEGKTASAWTEFNEALSRAIRDGRPEREARARERIAVLEPRVSRLTVSVAAGAAGELELSVDGISWGTALRNVGVPLDPGPHVVVARRAGGGSWSSTVVLGASADSKTLRIPLVIGSASGESVDSSGSVNVAAYPRGSGQRTTGWIVGGAGVAVLGVGTAFGILALSMRKASNADCTPLCTRQGVDLNNEAIRDAWISDFGVGLGVAGLVAGAYLLLTAGGSTPPQTTKSAVQILPESWSRGAGATVAVGW